MPINKADYFLCLLLSWSGGAGGGAADYILNENEWISLICSKTPLEERSSPPTGFLRAFIIIMMIIIIVGVKKSSLASVCTASFIHISTGLFFKHGLLWIPHRLWLYILLYAYGFALTVVLKAHTANHCQIIVMYIQTIWHSRLNTVKIVTSKRFYVAWFCSIAFISIWILYIPLHCTTFHSILLHCILFYCSAFGSILFHCIPFYTNHLQCIQLCSILLHCILYIVFYCSAFCSILFHCVPLYTTLFYCILLCSIPFLSTVWIHCILFYSVAVNYVLFYWIRSHYIQLYCIVFYCSEFHCSIPFCYVIYC